MYSILLSGQASSNLIKVLAYEIRTLVPEELILVDGTPLKISPALRNKIYERVRVSHFFDKDAALKAGLEWAREDLELSQQMTDYLNSDTTIWLENTLEYPIFMD